MRRYSNTTPDRRLEMGNLLYFLKLDHSLFNNRELCIKSRLEKAALPLDQGTGMTETGNSPNLRGYG